MQQMGERSGRANCPLPFGGERAGSFDRREPQIPSELGLAVFDGLPSFDLVEFHAPSVARACDVIEGDVRANVTLPGPELLFPG